LDLELELRIIRGWPIGTRFNPSRDQKGRGWGARGGAVVKYKFSLNVLKDTYDHSCY
jgi:hypothetical protein